MAGSEYIRHREIDCPVRPETHPAAVSAEEIMDGFTQDASQYAPQQ
jgi:hypothetical protein